MNIINKLELKIIKRRINHKIRKGCSVMILHHMSEKCFSALLKEGIKVRYEQYGSIFGGNASKYTIKLDRFIE